jgi:hypothetical protein
MLSSFIGEILQEGDGDPQILFKVNGIVSGDGVAQTVPEIGCKMDMPA